MIEPGILERGLVAFQLPLGLLEQHLEGARVDLGQRVPFADILTLREIHLVQLPVDPRVNDYRVKGRYRSQTREVDRQVASAGPRSAHRNDPAGLRGGRLRGGQESAATAAATSATAVFPVPTSP